jgi:hypothetical protein
MPLITVYRAQLKQSAVPRYERLIRFITERARQDKETFQWSARVANGGSGSSIGFITTAEGFAELTSREQPDDMIRRLFGEGDGNALIEALGDCVESSSYGISTVRDDLSNETQQEEPAPLALVTRLRSTSTGGPGLEEMIRQVIGAATKADKGRRYLTLQTVVGELRAWAVVQVVRDPAQLDRQGTVPDLLAEAYGQNAGEKIYREGIACIEHVESELSILRPDLSNQG